LLSLTSEVEDFDLDINIIHGVIKDFQLNKSFNCCPNWLLL